MAKSKIDETLKKLIGTTSKNESTISLDAKPNNSLGDPDCPYCQGAGYLRVDVPVGHPSFGKLEVCLCRKKSLAENTRDKLFSISHLHELRTLTFETFQPRGHTGLGKVQADSLERAYNHTKQYSKSLNGWMVLQGGFGCGKTHLAAAIANFAVGIGVPTLFLTVPDLLDTLRFSYDSEETTFENRFEEIRNSSLLILDDFGTQNATGWAQEKLFQIINYRYINKLPLVITTNLALDEIDPRIRSRIQDPELVSFIKILAPDYRRPSDEMGHLELSSLVHLKHRNFINFDPRKNEGLPRETIEDLRDAFEAARAFADSPDGWIVFVGPPGVGKTHLAAAIGNFRADLGIPPLFIVTPDLLDYLRATFSPESHIKYDRRFEEIKTTPLLILDDLGAHAQSAWAREKLFQIINHRYNAELPTVITMALDALEDTDSRIKTRLADARICEYYTITVPAYQHPQSKKEARKQKAKYGKRR